MKKLLCQAESTHSSTKNYQAVRLFNEAVMKETPAYRDSLKDQLSVCSFHSRQDEFEFSFKRQRPGSAKGEKLTRNSARKPPSESGENDRNSLDFEHSSTTASVQFQSFPVFQDIAELVKKFGEHVYELFAVMVHSGSAWSGHYYALILDSKTKKWYCFDDQKVTVVGVEDVFATFGEDKSKAQTGTSAYMLFYRKFDPKRENPNDIQPPHNIQVSILKEKETMLREKEEKKSILHLRLLHDLEISKKEIFLAINKNESLLKLQEKIQEALSLSSLQDFSFEIISQKRRFFLDLNEEKLLKEVPLKMLDTILLISKAEEKSHLTPKKKVSLHINDDIDIKGSRLNSFLSKVIPENDNEEEKVGTCLRKTSMDNKGRRSFGDTALTMATISKKKKKITNFLFKIVEWKEGIISLDENLLGFKEIKLPLSSSIFNLIEEISGLVGIPIASLVLIL